VEDECLFVCIKTIEAGELKYRIIGVPSGAPVSAISDLSG
jgi:hypothetical protein